MFSLADIADLRQRLPPLYRRQESKSETQESGLEKTKTIHFEYQTKAGKKLEGQIRYFSAEKQQGKGYTFVLQGMMRSLAPFLLQSSLQDFVEHKDHTENDYFDTFLWTKQDHIAGNLKKAEHNVVTMSVYRGNQRDFFPLPMEEIVEFYKVGLEAFKSVEGPGVTEVVADSGGTIVTYELLAQMIERPEEFADLPYHPDRVVLCDSPIGGLEPHIRKFFMMLSKWRKQETTSMNQFFEVDEEKYLKKLRERVYTAMGAEKFPNLFLLSGFSESPVLEMIKGNRVVLALARWYNLDAVHGDAVGNFQGAIGTLDIDDRPGHQNRKTFLSHPSGKVRAIIFGNKGDGSDHTNTYHRATGVIQQITQSESSQDVSIFHNGNNYSWGIKDTTSGEFIRWKKVLKIAPTGGASELKEDSVVEPIADGGTLRQ